MWRPTRTSPLSAPLLCVALPVGVALLAGGCGGAAPSGSTTAPEARPTLEDDEPEAPAGPSCEDGTCFLCGEGLCPRGAYCDASAPAGPACAWLTECPGETSCACVLGVLGSSCRCADASGGPSVTCP